MSDCVDIRDTNPTVLSVPNGLSLDYSKYSSDLENFDISDEQKQELLETMWSIMRLFVELGYSVDVSGRALKQIFTLAARGDEQLGA